MKIKFTHMSVLIGVLLLLTFPGTGNCLSASDMVTLKAAGVEDETIALLVKHKSVETCALMVEEIVELKNAGVGDETIRTIIVEGSFLKGPAEIVYGKDVQRVRLATVKDLIELKEAGLGDEVIRAVVMAAGNGDDADRAASRDMLRRMEIHIDQ
ncbi:MAG: hypothetical protein GY859_00210 [Desulfobacterales bacterium]|nr:hypothetical protein [Desulfobacterales bacterium]